jgi:RNA polymerase sigma-70 factor (ECF subfamily)
MKVEEFALIERIREGETELYSYFVTNYNKDIFQLAFQLTKDHALAEDLTQDVFVKGFLKIDTFQQKSQFLTWLYRIAYNLIINELRKRKVILSHYDETTVSSEEMVEMDDFFDKKETELRYQKLDEALKTLAQDEYALIAFYYYQQKQIEEIAFITEQTVANVKVKLFRIRKKLYNLMCYE